MKSFKQMVSEVAKPISPDEQRFIDQHTYEVQKHPVALDHQFTGDIAGKPSKTTEPDASTYDAAYAEKEPAVERIGEEVEQMDEISRSMTPMKNKFGGRVDPKKLYSLFFR
jgi:phosphoribosylaminoimidazole-succinocarboxamide synthase